MNICAFVTAKKVSCERISYNYTKWSFVLKKVCWMNTTTSINSQRVTMSSRDEAITGLNLYFNKKIIFMPKKIAEVFPNLLVINAQSCSLKEVTKENFKDLRSLTHLVLKNNRIEAIADSTFEDLTNLKILFLGKKVKLCFR
jgi:Leucine-rich repeat (LRR) protein